MDVSHHVTQSGNARGFVLDNDTDRGVYLTGNATPMLSRGNAVRAYPLREMKRSWR